MQNGRDRMGPLTEIELLTELEALRDQVRRLESRQRDLCKLLESQQALGVSLDPEQAQRTIVRLASSLAGMVGVRLFLLDEASATLRCCGGDRLPPDELRRLEFLIGECLSERAGPTDAPLPDAGAWSDFAPDPPALMLELDQAAYLGLLVALGDCPLGLLAFPIPASRNFTTEEAGLFGAFARQAAVTLQHARRYAAARRELAECQRAEAGIQSALAERDLLLREVHHRVKNNLQVVASLLDLQAGTVRDESARQALQESKDRVQSMARIHEYLCKSAGVSRIAMDDYLRYLATALRQAHNAQRIGLSVQVGVGPFEVERAIPCALIVHELVSNAFRHAFPAGRAGDVTVELKTLGDQHVLTVRDTGMGLPPHTDPHSVDSLGLRLVGLLAKQLGGRLHLAGEQGTTARIVFPVRPPDRGAA
jgi:two-component sensor histidine kinase